MFFGHVDLLRKRIQILLYGILEISIDLFGCQCAGGDERARTADPLLAKQVLSQLSYIPADIGIRRADPTAYSGGPSWGRTRDLALIKRAL